MSGGWLAGLAYFALCAVTRQEYPVSVCAHALAALYHIIYAAYVSVVAESVFIDIEHWRHYFLILGTLWGLMAASCAYARPALPARLAYSPTILLRRCTELRRKARMKASP